MGSNLRRHQGLRRESKVCASYGSAEFCIRRQTLWFFDLRSVSKSLLSQKFGSDIPAPQRPDPILDRRKRLWEPWFLLQLAAFQTELKHCASKGRSMFRPKQKR